MRWKLVAAGLFAATGALAQGSYNYLPFKMLNTSADPFEYYLDARSPNPAGLTLSNVQAATDNAWKRWDDVSCAATAFRARGLSTSANIPEVRDTYDVYNVSTIWIGSTSDPYYGVAIGSSDVTAMTLPLSYAGQLQQCDIFMNGAQRTWSTLAATPTGAVDVESIVLHEVGHCQGLDHSYTGELADTADVMYAITPIGSAKRTLTQRDIQALCTRYPASGVVGAPCLADGGCGQVSLKCVRPPLASGGFAPPMCSTGCPLNQNFNCGVPYVCGASSEFSPQYNGACLPPGEYVTQVGKPCTSAGECGSANGQCFVQNQLPSGAPAWTAGYCTQDCGTGQPSCPVGARCIDFGGGAFRCLKECRVGTGDCRSGYTCVLPSNGPPGVCVSSCRGDVDCGTGAVCRVCDGTCLSTNNPSGQIGDACTDASQCGAGQVCAQFVNGNNQGICSQPCGLACSSCPAGSTCHPIGSRGELYCLRDCTTGTCPSGLQCGYLPTGRGCVPRCSLDPECPVGTQCINGECRPPTSFDGGCALCPGGSDAGRPTQGLPADGGAGSGPGSGGCGCSVASPSTSTDALLWVLFLSCANLARRRQKP
ncbi:MAG: matrixin family metalloprotease [Myxococcota bacterium]